MKTSKLMALCAISVSLTACGLPGTFYVDSFSNQVITGNDFNSELAKAYQQRVFNTMETDTNGILAGYYTQKGEDALSGKNVLPWDYNTYQEQPTFRTGVPSDRAQKYNLDGLRSKLTSALDNNGRSKNPHACAQAQAHYDWLVDETFQDTPPAQVDEEDKIAVDLSRYLTDCEGVKVTKKIAPQAPNQYVIYFGWDRYDLTDEAKKVVKAAASKANSAASSLMSVMGFADTSGKKAYNTKLSVKRARSVAGALANSGVKNIKVSGYGESKLAKPTKDGVREPLNRFAVITVK